MKVADVSAPVYSAINEIPSGETGIYADCLVKTDGGAPFVLLMFNGAVAKGKLTDKPLYQRWSWLDDVATPAIVIPDPLVGAHNNLRLGWYVGEKAGPTFGERLLPLVEQIRSRWPGRQIVGVGSSGGGFAALMAAALGLTDGAVVNNPQTDILRYKPSLVQRFLDVYGETLDRLDDQDRSRLSLLPHASAFADRRVVYAQNLADEHHVKRHMIPFMRALYSADAFSLPRIQMLSYLDLYARHSPLAQDSFLCLLADFNSRILTDGARERARRSVLKSRSRAVQPE